jgi:hypothetical protein
MSAKNGVDLLATMTPGASDFHLFVDAPSVIEVL